MHNESELIKEDIAHSRDELGRKIMEFEEQVKDGVHATSEVIYDAYENVKATARNFSPAFQVRQHPLPAVGLAALAGFLVAAPSLRSPRRRRPQQFESPQLQSPQPEVTRFHAPQAPGLWDKLLDTFADEITLVKGMALGGLVKVLAEKASQVSPTLAPQIGEVKERLLSRVEKSYKSAH